MRQERKRAGENAFHVTNTATVIAPVRFAQGKRLARPRLSGDGNNVQMSGEYQSALAFPNAHQKRFCIATVCGQTLAQAGVWRDFCRQPIQHRAHVAA